MIKKKYNRLLVIGSTLATLTVPMPVSSSWAKHPYRGGPGPMPRGHAVIHVGAMAYFYVDGAFYRPGPRGYVVVPTPVGAVIAALPAGAILMEIDGVPYYTCEGVYYKQTRGGYVVISKPVKQMGPEIGIGQKLAVSVDLLNIRSGPSLSHEIVTQVKQGAVLEVETVSSEWCYVRTDNNSTG